MPPPSPLAPAKTAGGTPPHAATTHPTSPPLLLLRPQGEHPLTHPPRTQPPPLPMRHVGTARQRHANGTPTARQRHATARQRTGRQAVFGGQGEMGKTSPPLRPSGNEKNTQNYPPHRSAVAVAPLRSAAPHSLLVLPTPCLSYFSARNSPL